jgi:hypothetical protein
MGWLHVSVEFTMLVACVFADKNLRKSVCTSIRNVRDIVLSTNEECLSTRPQWVIQNFDVAVGALVLDSVRYCGKGIS